MKKPVLLALIVGAILVIAAIIFFSVGNKQEKASPETKTKKEFVLPKSSSSEENKNEEEASEESDSSDTTNTSDETVIPEPTSEDIRAAVLETGEEAEKKFLTPQQKRELNSASLTASKAKPQKEQTFSVEWKEKDFLEKLPELPSEAPVYLLDRPTEETTFDFLRTLSKNLGMKGAVLRSNRKNYSVANISTGEYYMTYDMYHLMFDATIMNVPVTGTVKETLENLGLLGFENTEEIAQDDRDRQWYRYIPKLPLPVVTMARTEPEGHFSPDNLGEVDVLSDGKKITRIISRFPNIVEKEVLPLLSPEEITDLLAQGEFTMGDVILQYPGALPTEEKREFYNYSRGDTIEITDAKITEVECGYFLEENDVLQALLSPVCIAHGQGKVGQNSVLFRTVFPAL